MSNGDTGEMHRYIHFSILSSSSFAFALPSLIFLYQSITNKIIILKMPSLYGRQATISECVASWYVHLVLLTSSRLSSTSHNEEWNRD